MANWGGTWSDGRKIEPAPGMLVALQDGTWGVITDVSGIPATHYALNHDGGHWYRDYNMTPIAPPPQPGGLWAALRGGLAEQPLRMVLDVSGPVVRIAHGASGLEAGMIYIPQPPQESWYEPLRSSIDYWDRIVGAAMYSAHMRDLQKYGALLAYCAQPGWEAQK